MPAKSLVFALISSLIILVQPSSAQACVDFLEAKLDDIRRADAVFAGELVSYEITTRPDGGDLRFSPQEAMLRVKVTSQFRGDLPPVVKLRWPNSTFAYPKELRHYSRSIFAATTDISGYRRKHSQSTDGEELTLFQPPCSGAFIMPYSEHDGAIIKQVLAGGAGSFDSLTAWGETELLTEPAITRSKSPPGVTLGVILVAALVAFGFLARAVARRNAL